MIRNIHDHRDDTKGSFEGVATFSDIERGPVADPTTSLHFRETGRLLFGNFSGPAERSLFFLQTSPSTMRVTFTDGRLFVDLDLRGGTPNVQHLCGDDVYEITFDFRSPDVVEEIWRVSGPRKDYEASTVMTRVDHLAAASSRRQSVNGLPERSTSATGPMDMDRSADLHMS